MSRWPKSLRALLVASSIVAITPGVLAQISTPEQQRTLDRMAAAPLDHENTFAYVTASVAARDYEAAIGALERLLVYNPGLSRVKYELGVLYHRTGSYAMALRYFEEAELGQDVDEPMRRRIEAYLVETRKQLSVSRLSGTVLAGLRYNSNVAGVPDGGFIKSFGVDVTQQGPFRARGDVSAIAAVDVMHIYDFQRARPFTWETGLLGYGSAQFRETDLSVGLFEISTGPRFSVSSDPLFNATLRPYAVGGSSIIDGHDYVSSFGGGASLSLPLGRFASVIPSVEGRSVHVRNPSVFGNLGTLSTGSLGTGAIAARWLVSDSVTFDGRVHVSRNSADAAVGTNDQWGLGASLKYDFAPPSDLISVNWSISAFVRYAEIHFDEPNPTVDPLIARRDHQTRVGLQLDAPFSPRFGLSVLGQHTSNESNIANFRGEAWSVLVGQTFRF